MTLVVLGLRPSLHAAARSCRAQAVVVYDLDSGLVLDTVAVEDAHQTKRVLAAPC